MGDRLGDLDDCLVAAEESQSRQQSSHGRHLRETQLDPLLHLLPTQQQTVYPQILLCLESQQPLYPVTTTI